MGTVVVIIPVWEGQWLQEDTLPGMGSPDPEPMLHSSLCLSCQGRECLDGQMLSTEPMSSSHKLGGQI